MALKRLIPDNYKQTLWFYRRSRLRTGTSAGSFDSSDFVRAVNEEDFPDNASVFATRLPIGKADHFPLDGNAVAFPAFPAIDLEPGKSL